MNKDDTDPPPAGFCPLVFVCMDWRLAHPSPMATAPLELVPDRLAGSHRPGWGCYCGMKTGRMASSGHLGSMENAAHEKEEGNFYIGAPLKGGKGNGAAPGGDTGAKQQRTLLGRNRQAQWGRETGKSEGEGHQGGEGTVPRDSKRRRKGGVASDTEKVKEWVGPGRNSKKVATGFTWDPKEGRIKWADGSEILSPTPAKTEKEAAEEQKDRATVQIAAAVLRCVRRDRPRSRSIHLRFCSGHAPPPPGRRTSPAPSATSGGPPRPLGRLGA